MRVRLPVCPAPVKKAPKRLRDRFASFERISYMLDSSVATCTRLSAILKVDKFILGASQTAYRSRIPAGRDGRCRQHDSVATHLSASTISFLPACVGRHTTRHNHVDMVDVLTTNQLSEPSVPSCESCRRRKLKCPRQQPSCATCDRLGMPGHACCFLG
jgi:hypothetical protein